MSSIQELIALKQNAEIFTEEQINAFIDQLLNGSLHDAQIGAFLMAVFLKGMTSEESAALTSAMKKSGDVLDWPAEWKYQVVDKHSTGGVGDKISLILAPAVASCGLKLPMISGRSLGFTGGTLDKLESIPGFNIKFSPEDITKALETAGCCIVGQTATLVPADKILYSIRDITSTVGSFPLIASSIVSKKAAGYISALVLDVKYGSGSYQKTLFQAEELASLMVDISCQLGIKTSAVITHMDHPIGKMVGNAVEVIESIECLQGKGPNDLMELVTTQGGVLLYLKGICESPEKGKEEIERRIKNGDALKTFEEMAIIQGVEKTVAENLCKNPYSVLSLSSNNTILHASSSGFISDMKAISFGEVSSRLGNGRQVPTDDVTYDTGIQILRHVGDEVKSGDPILKVYHKEKTLDAGFKSKLEQAVTVSSTKPKPRNRVEKVIHRSSSSSRIFMVSQ
ncbi:thymidine phosphorylase-like [Clytia hemisphaerica]|uniref:Thymidine phosphorylase n=1 Tax=Clytia hemisphaerica TaxID=252671 RepID=A0A7M5V3J2_9CNID